VVGSKLDVFGQYFGVSLGIGYEFVSDFGEGGAQNAGIHVESSKQRDSVCRKGVTELQDHMGGVLHGNIVHVGQLNQLIVEHSLSGSDFGRHSSLLVLDVIILVLHSL